MAGNLSPGRHLHKKKNTSLKKLSFSRLENRLILLTGAICQYPELESVSASRRLLTHQGPRMAIGGGDSGPPRTISEAVF